MTAVNVSITLALCFAPAIALADEPDPSTEEVEASSRDKIRNFGASRRPWAVNVSSEDQARALTLLRDGNDHFKDERYTEALTLYRQALKHWDHPVIRFNIAKCLTYLGRPATALTSMELALQYGPRALGDVLYKQAVSHREQLRQSLARLTISTPQDEVEITINGETVIEYGSDTKSLYLRPGRYQLVANRVGFIPHVETLKLAPGEQYTRELRVMSIPRTDVRPTTTSSANCSAARTVLVWGAGGVLAFLGAGSYQRRDHDIAATLFIASGATILIGAVAR